MRALLETEWTDGCAGEWPNPQEKDVRRPPLTVRTIHEILEMKFDDADLILENGYAVKGDLTACCGMGGSANRAGQFNSLSVAAPVGTLSDGKREGGICAFCFCRRRILAGD